MKAGKCGFQLMVFSGLLAVAIGIGIADAQDFTYHDNFDDGDVTNATDGGVWNFRAWGSNSTMDARSGDLEFMADNKFVDGFLNSFDGVSVEERTEWSFRARVTVHSGPSAAVGTTAYNYAALTPGGLQVGTLDDFDTEPIPYPYYEEELLLQFDAFDSILTGTVWKENEPRSLVRNTRTYNPVSTLPNFAVGSNGGGPANVTFHEAWVSTTPLPIVVPEPSSFALAGLSLTGVVALSRRRRKR